MGLFLAALAVIRPALFALTFLFFSTLFVACDSASVERRYYADGTLAEETAYLTDDQGYRVRHGLRLSWHANGERSRLEVFNRGKPTGYVITWDTEGRLLNRHQAFAAAETLIIPSDPSATLSGMTQTSISQASVNPPSP